MVNALTPAKTIWSAVQGQLQIGLDEATYETWLAKTEGVLLEERCFVVAVPTAFGVAWLERRLYAEIQDALKRVTGMVLDVQFTVATQGAGNSDIGRVAQQVQGRHMGKESPIHQHPVVNLGNYRSSFNANERYTFDRFVVGAGNEMAYAAASAVGAKPGDMYNPLFIYSSVGLGKTHLIQAIGAACVANGHTVEYAASETFTNEFINAIRAGTTDDFRAHYRSADVLLIDDVQFMVGKEQTQEGFFHTFNELYASGRQVVLTSDRPPSELGMLQERLVSRFSGGLVVDIQSPDLETRIAILEDKAHRQGLRLPHDVCEFIGKRRHRNVRELEGDLNKLSAYSMMSNCSVTLEYAIEVLGDQIGNKTAGSVTPDDILGSVAYCCNLAVSDILSRARTRKVVQARQIVMYLLINELLMSPTDIGRVLAGRNHATVIHGAGKINAAISEDDSLRSLVMKAKEAIFTEIVA
tara:strand:- start:2108 stop:3511 length:1404 start_codon:yes stop_codon:yes gene_type:complete